MPSPLQSKSSSCLTVPTSAIPLDNGGAIPTNANPVIGTAVACHLVGLPLILLSSLCCTSGWFTDRRTSPVTNHRRG